jgi:hypothetical protein
MMLCVTSPKLLIQFLVIRPTDYGHFQLVGRVYIVAEIPDGDREEISISLV